MRHCQLCHRLLLPPAAPWGPKPATARIRCCGTSSVLCSGLCASSGLCVCSWFGLGDDMGPRGRLGPAAPQRGRVCGLRAAGFRAHLVRAHVECDVDGCDSGTFHLAKWTLGAAQLHGPCSSTIVNDAVARCGCWPGSCWGHNTWLIQGTMVVGGIHCGQLSGHLSRSLWLVWFEMCAQ